MLKLRLKKSHKIIAKGNYFRFNPFASPREVLVHGDSVPLPELEICLPHGKWQNLLEAFRKKDVIVDWMDICFFVPSTEIDRERGYTLC